ncbi:pyruvate oxidase [Bacillus velezensis]|uniref:pyruvate oxidase n=1 Tax=Bacillus TaxID=1386 RepID=UPI00057EA560|nr:MULTISPECIES: pyruvate oxidase [Bacillus]AJC25030.1 thiamine pyrophosphate-binding protein [Bacillus sp. Pc3]ASS62225.1 Putative thiamine pyrophosphate-containing protein YdaP [Bacillus velezensis]ATC51804.1 Putative thiamine pyrophosphate-containing protein YdaP [Bacillus velezensis]AUJ61297.1 pyruvate oxidase [Bacillus velezensis]MBD8888231.1 pyruvate oxidase [Bacillus velezensis]
MPSKTAGHVMTELLEQWGVGHIYGIPGDSINEFIEELRHERNNLTFIQTRHEEVAALAAAAEAKLTGQIGVCLSIAGPGAVHLLNGLYDAKADGVPVLAIAGQVASDEIGRDSFQEIKLEQMFEDVAVFNQQVHTAEALPDLLNQAIRTAYSKKGVAVLTVSDDLFAQKIKREPVYTSPIYLKADIEPKKEHLVTCAQYINNAKKPVILAGQGLKSAKEELLAFADKAAAPIVITLPAKGVVPDSHPHFLGNLGQIGTKPAYEAMEECDLLIMLGTSFPYRDYLPDDTPAIQLDSDPAKIGKRYPVNAGIVSDAALGLKELTEYIEYKEDRRFLDACTEHMKHWWKEIEKDETEATHPLKPQQVIARLQDAAAEDAVLSVDVGTVTVWMARHFKMKKQDFIVSSWLATMGCGLPGAIAASLAEPERQSIAICGDGGFSMVMQDLPTAVKYKLPITVVILNNENLGMIEYEQRVKGNIDYVTQLQNMDYAAFAKSCGAKGIKVTKHEELAPAFHEALNSNEPVVIDAVIGDEPPLPGKITYGQAKGFSKYMLKNFFENQKIEMPSLKKSLKRLF